jgi:hypothetical protein
VAKKQVLEGIERGMVKKVNFSMVVKGFVQKVNFSRACGVCGQ